MKNMKEIKTSNGKFIVENVGYNEIQDIVHIFEGEDVFVIWDENGKVRFSININNKPFYKLSKITEEEASNIVDGTIIHQRLKTCNYKYRSYIEGFLGFNKAIESLHSLLESQEIEITNNTYIFKV